MQIIFGGLARRNTGVDCVSRSSFPVEHDVMNRRFWLCRRELGLPLLAIHIHSVWGALTSLGSRGVMIEIDLHAPKHLCSNSHGVLHFTITAEIGIPSHEPRMTTDFFQGKALCGLDPHYTAQKRYGFWG